MSYITIDTHSKHALPFLEYAKTLPFVKVYNEPNIDTLKSMEDAKKGRTKKFKSAKELISYLNK